MPDVEVPTAPAGLHSEPALIFGILGALAAGLLTLLGAGGLDDGWQWVDLGVIATPLLVALGARQLTFPQATADLMAPRNVQRKAVEQRKRR